MAFDPLEERRKGQRGMLDLFGSSPLSGGGMLSAAGMPPIRPGGGSPGMTFGPSMPDQRFTPPAEPPKVWLNDYQWAYDPSVAGPILDPTQGTVTGGAGANWVHTLNMPGSPGYVDPNLADVSRGGMLDSAFGPTYIDGQPNAWAGPDAFYPNWGDPADATYGNDVAIGNWVPPSEAS